MPPAPALSPDEALKSFQLPPGFRIELVAAEPLVEDPVTCRWDADGRIWVVEMRGYMTTPEGADEDKPTGRVVVLEDVDGDGRMDRSTVFLDGLVMPRALALVEGGVLIGEPPTLWYCRDTDGDLKCDEKTAVYDSYGQRDAASRTASGLTHALDNWIYNTRLPVRFQFREGKLEVEPDFYRGDWGVAQDDFGRLYANTNSSYLHADLYPYRYILRHSNLQDPAGIYERVASDQSVHSVRVNTGIVNGFVIGMLRPDGRLARNTATCSPTIYRGDRYPPEFYGNAFIPEPAGNVVARFSLSEDGIGLQAMHELTPDPKWEQREFLASSDERFRPVHCETGPDGCLHIVDFYRGIIEYKLFVTPWLRDQIVQRKLDRPLGLGRIYRIVHEAKAPGTQPKMSRAGAVELVENLSHPNAWWRDTAQRLLVQRRDPAAIEPLRALVATGKNPLGRQHALWTLEGMGAADATTVFAAMDDAHPRVKIAAMRIGESLSENPDYLFHLLRLMEDPDLAVQLQAMFSLGQLRDDPEARQAMIQLLIRHTGSAYFRHAAISGLAGRELVFLRELHEYPEFETPRPGNERFLEELAVVIRREQAPSTLVALLQSIGESAGRPWRQVALLDGILKASGKSRPMLLDREPDVLAMLGRSDSPDVQRRLARVERLVTWPGDARKSVAIDQIRPLNAEERAQFDRGRQTYRAICMACHQIHGRGMMSMAPPLLGSPWVLGSEERLIRIVLQGIYGPLHINNVEWNLVMPGQSANPAMTDAEIAAVLTYIRREWDHTGDPVTADSVQKVRAATADRTLPWTVEELENIP